MKVDVERFFPLIYRNELFKRVGTVVWSVYWLLFLSIAPLIVQMIDQSIDWLIDWSIAPLIACWIDWLIDWSLLLRILPLDYPACCLTGNVELTREQLEAAGEPTAYCWRNLHACINLVRILNKLAKWKRSRVLVLVLFKSAAILKRALRIRNPIMQLYTLKALKLQSKFLGRQWRRLNMRTLSAIYEKVRHRLMDDWAYGNGMDWSNQIKTLSQIEMSQTKMEWNENWNKNEMVWKK